MRCCSGPPYQTWRGCDPGSIEVKDVPSLTSPTCGSSGSPRDRWLTTVPEKPWTFGCCTAAISAVGVVGGREAVDEALEEKTPVAAKPATQATPTGASHLSAGWRC